MRRACVRLCAAVLASLVLRTACGQSGGAATPDDSLEQFLVDRGLHQLLAEQLAQRVDTAVGDDRLALAEKLSGVYAELLERAGTGEEGRLWEGRALDLLTKVPEADSVDLRLSLSRAAYLRAERTAERWRLRLVDAGEAESARRALVDLADQFAQVALRAEPRIGSLERQQSSAGAQDQELIDTALASARRHRSLAHFYAGWSLLYAVELGAPPESAATALRHFGTLLDARKGEFPALDRAPVRLMRYEHIARAALGAASCFALLGDQPQAIRWLELVEQTEGVTANVVAQAPLRRLIILAGAGRWADAAAQIDRLREPPSLSTGAPAMPDRAQSKPLEPAMARLLGVLSFEAIAEGVNATPVRRMREVALADLVARAQLSHVLDLTSRFGTEALGDTGFIALHVRGLRAYEQARAAHRALGEDEEEPVPQRPTAEVYLSASNTLRAALQATDAPEFPEARASTAMLLAFSIYYASGAADKPGEMLTDASLVFEQAASLFPDPERASDALWMAVRCIERIEERVLSPGDPSVKVRLAELASRYIERYPADQRASVLKIRAASLPEADVARSIAMLLDVPVGTAAYEPARRQASRMLYDQFARASGTERDYAARRYIEVSEPLLAIDRRAASLGNTEAAGRAGVLARRICELALALSVPDVDRAERTLDLIRSLITARQIDAQGLEGELALREAQLALARGDAAGAEAAIAKLEPLDPAAARAGRRLLYARALEAWRHAQSAADSATLTRASRELLRHARAVLKEFADDDEPLRRQGVAGLYVVCIAAGTHLWQAEQDAESRDLALALCKVLMRERPEDPDLLRRGALLAEGAGDLESASQWLAALVRGMEQGSDAWFDATVLLARVLSQAEPDRAAELLRRHRLIYPDFGRQPWADQLRLIEASLAANDGSGSGDDD